MKNKYVSRGLIDPADTGKGGFAYMSQRNGIMSRVLAVVLVFTLCLAMGGCGDKKNSGGHTTDKKSETQAKGRFLEQERKLPKEVTTLLSAVERTDGVVEAFGYSDESS